MGQSGGMEIQDHLLIRESRRFSHDKEQIKYEGSPYANDQFQSANVHSGDLKFRAVPMRYNIAEDVMEFQVARTTYLLDPDPKIARIDIGDETYIVPKSRRSFYVAHVMGNLSLLSKSVVNLRPVNDLMGILKDL